MASKNSSLYDKQVGSAGKAPSASYPLERDAGAAIKKVVIALVAGTDFSATSDTVTLYRAKIGSKLIPSESRITCENTGTTCTVSIGDGTTAAKYLNGAALGGAARDAAFPGLPSVTAVAAQYVPVEITDSIKDIVLTATSVSSLTAGAKILVTLAFLDA